ncbi:MAG: hypothetical protein E7052_09245 [Lentisphaerae bacterium]|nr:hypothetical protein [Lentisphaerota bacterium]
MLPEKLQQALDNNTGSYIMPFLWYSGENKTLVAREMAAIAESGAKEFIFENRGGDWFGTDFWWDIFGFVLDTARSMNMRVWCIDDSHVNTGSANDSLDREENAQFRAKNLRIDMADIAGPITAGAVSLPGHSEVEKIVRIIAYKRNEVTGDSYGEPIDLTDNLQDGICLLTLPEGVWRIYFVMTADPQRNGLFSKYITMVSKESCRHLINEIHEKMYAHFADYFGNTFAGFFSDEPAFGNCDGQYGPNAYNLRLGQIDKMFPWWDDFPQQLAERSGCTPEEVMLKLPALWDGIENVSAPLRLAYMDLVTDLWRKNFSEQLGQWCEAHNVEYIGHNLEDADAHMRTGWGCGHYFRSMEGQHMSGMDLVFEQLTPGISTVPHAMNTASRIRSSSFYHYTLPKLAASLAHQTPHMHNRAMSEVFGATGWTCGACNNIALFNHTLINAVTYFVPHAFSMSLPTVFEQQQERKNVSEDSTPPGYCMKYLPPTFFTGGYNPQFKVFGQIIRYVQRVAHILDQHRHLPDVALYYCAESDWMNMAPYRSMDDAAMQLIRGGYDFDFLPLETLLKRCSVKDDQLCCGQESFKALVIPGSRIIVQDLLKKLQEFAAAGLKVCFTDQLPETTEYGPIAPETLSGFAVADCRDIATALQKSCPRNFDVKDYPADLRHYRFVSSDGEQGCVIFNSGRSDIAVAPQTRQALMIYDPWKNQLYRLGEDNNFTLPSQKLMVLFAGNAPADTPEFPAAPQQWQVLPLQYNIYCRAAGTDGDFTLLRRNSPAVDLNKAEKLTRYCGEFRYEAEFDCSDPRATMLEIPYGADAAELILNGQSCGIAVGPVCRFDISKALQPGKNTLQIHTWDSPAYADREGDKSIGYGSGYPLRPHGFTGDILIG